MVDSGIFSEGNIYSSCPPPRRSVGKLCAAEGRESISSISGENSRTVITLSQAIKLLPRSDRWQMLEGLFIFCLLIRAARRGGSTQGWGLERQICCGGEGGKKEHLVPAGGSSNFSLYISSAVREPPFGFARIGGSSLTPLMWEINDATR